MTDQPPAKCSGRPTLRVPLGRAFTREVRATTALACHGLQDWLRSLVAKLATKFRRNALAKST